MSDPASPIGRIARDVAHEVVVNVLAALAVAALAFVALGGRLDDLYVRLRHHSPVSGQVALLAIDAEALYLWNPYDPAPETTPRGLLAETVRFLHDAGARVVVVDVLTDQPATGDAELANALLAHPRSVVAERFEPGRGEDLVPFAAGSVFSEIAVPAYANLGTEEQTLFSGEFIVRSVPLVQGVARARLSGAYPMSLFSGFQDDEAPVPALALAAAWLHTSTEPPAELMRGLASRCGGRPLVCTAGTDAFGLPTGWLHLHESWPLNFRGPEGADGIPTIPAARVLRLRAEASLAASLGGEPPPIPDDLRAQVKDRTVVIGRVDAQAGDAFVTPYSFPAMSGADMSGPRVHAQLIDTLLTGRHIRRVGGAASWALAAAAAVLVVVTGRRWPGGGHLAATLSVALGAVGFGAWLFHVTDSVAVDVGPLVAAVLSALLVVHLYARAEST